MNVTTSSGPPRRLSIMLVDDHELARRGVRSLIEAMPEWSICAEAADGPTALELAARLRPDVVVLDISMPRLSGLELIGELRRILPGVEILALTLHDGERIVAQALKAGARGYVLKSESGEKLLEALAALSRHQTWFCSSVSEGLLRAYLASASPEPGDRLTARERQIVRLVAAGQSNRQIAQALRVSIKTVESHRGAAMRKVGARSAADLTLYAIRNELAPA
jgi:DNA-binding NarL/FixJ family response regulator